MDPEELRRIVNTLTSIRVWLQSTLNVPPSRDQQLVAIHELGGCEGALTRELEKLCSQSVDADSNSAPSTPPPSETSQ